MLFRSKGSGASYSSRGVQNTGPNPAGGSQKPQGQGRMTRGQRAEMQYRKANLLKKEEVEQVDEASPIYSRGGEQRRTQTPRQIGVKGAPHNIPRGGTTISDRDPEGNRLFTGDQDRGKGNEAARRAAALAARRAAALKPKEKRFPNRLTRSDRQGITDSYDIYDIILSHLLDEGYAETPEAAEAIMVNMSEEWRDSIVEEVIAEATAMSKRGHDETAIRNRIAASTGGGEAADRATALADRPSFGSSNRQTQRQNLARAQRGDFRKTTSSNPGLHVGQHKSDDPAVKAKQAARGAQRGRLTPGEKKQLGR